MAVLENEGKEMKFAVIYCNDVEVSGEVEVFDTLEEAREHIRKCDESYTPPHAYWVILEFVNRIDIPATYRRY